MYWICGYSTVPARVIGEPSDLAHVRFGSYQPSKGVPVERLGSAVTSHLGNQPTRRRLAPRRSPLEGGHRPRLLGWSPRDGPGGITGP